MTQLASNVDDASPFMQQERRKAMAQAVWPRVRESGGTCGTVERPSATRLASRLRLRPALLALEHQVVAVRTTASQSPPARFLANIGGL